MSAVPDITTALSAATEGRGSDSLRNRARQRAEHVRDLQDFATLSAPCDPTRWMPPNARVSARSPSGQTLGDWCPDCSPWLIACAVMLPTFMEVLDTSIASVALPHIAGSLSASRRRSHLGADQLPGGERGDPSGQRMVFAAVRPAKFSSVLHRLFTVSSFMCGAANSLGIDSVCARCSRGGRRSAATSVAGDSARKLSAGEARVGHGRVRTGGGGCAGAGADAGRIFDR